jgi:hypothetical protein
LHAIVDHNSLKGPDPYNLPRADDRSSIVERTAVFLKKNIFFARLGLNGGLFEQLLMESFETLRTQSC